MFGPLLWSVGGYKDYRNTGLKALYFNVSHSLKVIPFWNPINTDLETNNSAFKKPPSEIDTQKVPFLRLSGVSPSLVHLRV